MHPSLPFVGIPLPFTQLFRNMVQQFTVAAVNRRMVRNGRTKAANQYIAGLRTGCADTVKSRRLQVVQIEIFSLIPPVVLPVKIRHIHPRQMVRVAEQRVTVRHTMRKLPPGQVRHAAEFINPLITDQPPRHFCSLVRLELVYAAPALTPVPK